MSIKMEVWGDYACFTRPEMKVERVSYERSHAPVPPAEWWKAYIFIMAFVG